MKNTLMSMLLLVLMSQVTLAQNGEKEKKTWGEATVMAITATSTFGAYTSTQYMLSSYYATNLAAPEGASGTLTVPAGLGVGPVVPLNITNTKPYAQADRLYYWGCSDVVLKDQPQIRGTNWKAKDQWWTVLSSAHADAMKMMGLTQASKIPGTYKMESGYTGEMSVALTEAQQFLPPLKVTAPATDKVDTAQAINVTWDAAEGAGGYHLMAMGKNDKGQDVTWENSYNAVVWQRIGLAKSLKMGLLHGPDSRSCTIPAGIFKGQVTITVTGVSSIATGTGAFSYWGWAQTMSTKILNMGT